MVLASVGCAAIAVIRPLTLPAAWFEFRGEGPIGVQVVVLRATAGPEGACRGRADSRGVQGVKWVGRTGACSVVWF